MTLRTVPSDRDVRTRSTGFRVDLRTRYVTVCVLQEGVGEAFSSIFTTDINLSYMSELVRLVFALTLEHVT
jgi:hypothetical protein